MRFDGRHDGDTGEVGERIDTGNGEDPKAHSIKGEDLRRLAAGLEVVRSVTWLLVLCRESRAAWMTGGEPRHVSPHNCKLAGNCVSSVVNA